MKANPMGGNYELGLNKLQILVLSSDEAKLSLAIIGLFAEQLETVRDSQRADMLESS